jgi:hypothetical protein
MNINLDKLTDSIRKIIVTAGKSRRTLAACLILAVTVYGTANIKSMEVGKDAVVMGKVPATARIGDGSIIIGPTDANGNITLTAPMAVGRNAHAGPNSIAIGAGAGAQ